jgi:uncharacterized RDD family membrane protein YckC/tRNA A-37 threonylcarbamoyl transferase component Bud32
VKPELDDTLAAPSPEPRTATVPRTEITHGPGLQGGQQLGHFRIERRIGAGGMGEVYLATDLALDRPVAIKVLPDAAARDPQRRDRLVREARAQARVAHPNVGHMYFIGEEAGRLFFAMEYVNGKTLGETIAQGPMTVDDALSVIRAAALGLREASREGYTHRDVKPSNLMLDNHGMVKVLDFGLAAGEPGQPIDAPVAQTSLAGTPLYMAPEQARGEAVDLRADIYALGATLYHLISGKPPFQADSVDELLSLHATSARPAVPRRGIPRTQIGAIDALIGRMMAPKPADRFADYDELLRAIELASVAQTRPGGFWVRAIAMGIDMIVLTLATAFTFNGIASLAGYEPYDLLLQFVVMTAYFGFAHARWGRTIGKAIFELEVVDVVTTRKPSLAVSLRRAIIMFAIPIILGVLEIAVDVLTDDREVPDVISAGLTTLLAVLGGLALLYASARVSGKRAPWDRWCGTMVRYRTTRTAAK